MALFLILFLYLKQNFAIANNFSGAFDTNIPPPGSIIFSSTYVAIPSIPIAGLPVEYGLSENISIGSNLLLPLSWAQGGIAYGGKIKLRQHLSSDFTLSESFYIYNATGGLSKSSTKNNANTLASMGLLTTSYNLGVNTQLFYYASAVSLHITTATPSSSVFQNTSSLLCFTGLGATHYVYDWLGLRMQLFLPVYTEQSSDSALDLREQSLSLASFISFTQPYYLAIASLDYQASEAWLFSIGLAYFSDKKRGWFFDASYMW